MSTFSLPHLEPPVQAPTISPESELEALREDARREGLAAGRAEALQELSAIVQHLRAIEQEMAERRDALCDAVEPAAITLALTAAEQIVGAALDVRPELVAETLERALRRLTERERVTVLVNPEELELLSQRAPEIAQQIGGIEHLDVQADRRIARGGLIVQTPEGDVDARLDTRVERLGEIVREALVA